MATSSKNPLPICCPTILLLKCHCLPPLHPVGTWHFRWINHQQSPCRETGIPLQSIRAIFFDESQQWECSCWHISAAAILLSSLATVQHIAEAPPSTTWQQFICSTAAVSTFGAWQYENGRLGQVTTFLFKSFQTIFMHKLSLSNFSDGASNNKDEWFV